MNMHSGRRHEEPRATLERRVLALEDRVSALAEALRVLAHGLEDLPAAEPAGRRAAEAARQAYDLLLVAGQHVSEPDRRPVPDDPRGQLPRPGALMAAAPVRLFACGDVMTGRGVDQILPHPGDPQLRECYADDARAYVRLAERANGPIPWPVSFAWPWGDALQILDAMAPDVRLINLETAVTRQGDFAPGKAVHYRMSPRNLPCVAAVRPDVCVLANNHVLDFGRTGLEETLAALGRAGLAAAGAGRDAAAAWRPVVVPLPGGGRVLVFSCGTASSGIPPGWAAAAARPGVSFLYGMSADTLIARAEAARRDGDLVVVSIHWGANWGYDVTPEQVRFAHKLIDGGISLIHGHSSHHPRPAEVYRGRLILYGCGDCIDDYEGISGHEEFRDELRLLYFASLTPGTGTLQTLRMVPVRARKMRLQRASPADIRWLTTTLNRINRGFGSRIERQPDGSLLLRSYRPASP